MSPTTRSAPEPGIAEALSRLADATTAGTRGLPQFGADQIDKLKKYLEVLLLWRSRIALISTADPVLLVEHHILDSLHVAEHIPERARVADIGSGAGLPGIPLAVARPQALFTLIESRRRKANFLREARRLAGLQNVQVVEARAEEALRPASFDVIVSRALGAVDEFLDHGGRLLVAGGVAVAMRGPDGDQDAVADTRFEPPKVLCYELTLDRRRTLLVYRRR